MAQIGQRPLNARAASGAILPCQLQIQFFNFRLRFRSSARADFAGIIFPGHESLMPCQQRAGSDQACKAIQGFAAKPFAFDRQPAALVVIKTGLLAQQVPSARESTLGDIQ